MLTAAIFFTLHARGRCCHHSPDSLPRKAKEQLGPGQSIIVSVASGVRGEQRACAESPSLFPFPPYRHGVFLNRSAARGNRVSPRSLDICHLTLISGGGAPRRVRDTARTFPPGTFRHLEGLWSLCEISNAVARRARPPWKRNSIRVLQSVIQT